MGRMGVSPTIMDPDSWTWCSMNTNRSGGMITWLYTLWAQPLIATHTANTISNDKPVIAILPFKRSRTE
jgi:hypothetical protein